VTCQKDLALLANFSNTEYEQEMKTFACIGFPIMIITAILLRHRDSPETGLNSALFPLPKGRTNPPLERLGHR
jgi:hypothetical protein